MAKEIHETELRCGSCGRDTLHQVAYAGRLLTRVTCTECGRVLHVDRPSLPNEYLKDLSQRVRTKPGRLAHRALKHPLTFFRSLPRAILRQPGKLLGEFEVIHDEDRRTRPKDTPGP